MYRPRIIPVLLLRDLGLVKSTKFKNHRYIGDPINAVKIFNDLTADEIVFLDIDATKQNRFISIDFVKKVGEEANMPFSVGGGIRNLDEIRKLIESGAEKVILNSVARENPKFVKEAADEFGSSTIVVCIDVKKNLFGKEYVYTRAGNESTKIGQIEYAKMMEDLGAGEVIVQSIDRDGMMSGYDKEMIKAISERLSIPIVALGGAGSVSHMRDILDITIVNGLAAGSMFVYQGSRKAVLINYPERKQIQEIFNG